MNSLLISSIILRLLLLKSEEWISVYSLENLVNSYIIVGGLKKEWLSLLAKELFDAETGLFKLSSNTRTIHPSPLSIIHPKYRSYFRLAGLLTGIVDIPCHKQLMTNLLGDQNTDPTGCELLQVFPQTTYRYSFSFILYAHQLNRSNVDIPLNLSDLEDIEPEMTNSLRWMQNNDVTSLQQSFTYELDVFGVMTQQELQPDGSNVIVDESNKAAFISKMYHAKMSREAQEQISIFQAGLFEVTPKLEMTKLFSANELEMLICGKSIIDVADLKQCTRYHGLSRNCSQVKWFWEILEDMDQTTLASLLFFITGKMIIIASKLTYNLSDLQTTS